MDLPPHPDRNDTSPAERSTRRTSTTTRVVVGVLIALVVVVIVLHLTGVVGPLSH